MDLVDIRKDLHISSRKPHNCSKRSPSSFFFSICNFAHSLLNLLSYLRCHILVEFYLSMDGTLWFGSEYATDLTPFQQIIACGIWSCCVGSIKSILREFDRCRALESSSRLPTYWCGSWFIGQGIFESFPASNIPVLPSSNGNYQW